MAGKVGSVLGKPPTRIDIVATNLGKGQPSSVSLTGNGQLALVLDRTFFLTN
jgi:hypothetical protein